MPGIRKRKDGRYEIRKMENGKRISVYAKTIKQAQKLLTKVKNNKIESDKVQSINKKYTLTEWILYWEETYKKPFVNKKTLRDIHSYLKKVFISLGEFQLTNITTIKLQEFLNNLEQNRTKERIQTYLNAILQKAEDLDIIKKNPFKAVERSKKGKHKNICFSYEEQVKILKEIKKTKIEHEIMCYLMTGARPNELPTKQNFDFKNRRIIINGTKNENAKHREIQISEEFSVYMQKYLEKTEMLSKEIVKREFKKVCEKCNIKNGILYRLRHTFASNHFVLGTHTKQVSEWLGHSTVTLTLDTYTDIDKTITKEKLNHLYNNFYYTTN